MFLQQDTRDQEVALVFVKCLDFLWLGSLFQNDWHAVTAHIGNRHVLQILTSHCSELKKTCGRDYISIRRLEYAKMYTLDSTCRTRMYCLECFASNIINAKSRKKR